MIGHKKRVVDQLTDIRKEIERTKKENERTMKRELFGIEVDESYYKEVTEKKYILEGRKNGMYTSAYEGDTLQMIELFANSKDYQEHEPELVAEAKQMLELIKSEVLQYNKTKGFMAKGGHATLPEYFGDLKSLYDVAVDQKKEIEHTFDEQTRLWSVIKDTYKEESPEYIMAHAEYVKAQKDKKESLEELRRNTISALDSISNAFNSHVSSFYMPNGANIHTDTLTLLNSGIELTSNEINSLVDSFKHNPTMLRIIDDYCKKHYVESQSLKKYGMHARKGGQPERDIFETSANNLLKVVGDDPVVSSVWGNPDNGHFERINNQCINNINEIHGTITE